MRSACCALGIACLYASFLQTTVAQTVTSWIDPAGGFYYFGSNWSASNVADNANEFALFDLNSTYNVTISQNLAVTVGSLIIDDGNVTFAADEDGLGSYSIAGDLLVQDGGRFNLSQAGGLNDIDMVVGDEIQVKQGGLLFADLGSTLTANSLQVGDANSGGQVFLESGSTLDITAGGVSLGVGNGLGNLVFQNGSTGSAFVGLTRVLGDTTQANAAGNLLVRSGSTLALQGLMVGTTPSAAAAQSATVTVDGSGSSITQANTSTLTVGDAENGNVTALVDVSNGGLFTTGTGLTHVINSGRILMQTGGAVDFGGNVTIDGGRVNQIGLGLGGGATLAPGATVNIENGGEFTEVLDRTFNGAVTIAGADSLWQSANGTINSDIDVTSGGKLQFAGGGLTRINSGSTVDVASTASLDFGGDIRIDGGTLDVSSSSTNPQNFVWTPSKSLAVINSGALQIGGFGIDSPTGASYLVAFDGEVSGAGNAFDLLGGSSIEVTDGGRWLKSVRVLQGSTILVEDSDSELGNVNIASGSVTLASGATTTTIATRVGDALLAGQTATYNIESGAVATFTDFGTESLQIGASASASGGEARVTVDDATLNVESVEIGNVSGATGELRIVNDARVNATGTITVNATGTLVMQSSSPVDVVRLTTTDDIVLNGGTLQLSGGVLEVSGAGFVPNPGPLVFAGTPQSNLSSTLRLNDAATMNVAGPLTVATNRNFSLQVFSGSQVTSTSASIASGSTASMGTVSVSGEQSMLSVTEGLAVGDGGSGTLFVSSGATLNSGSTTLAAQQGFGRISLSSGGVWSAADASVGGTQTTSGGTGVLEIRSNSSVDITGRTVVWDFSRIEIDGGTFTASGGLDLESGGTTNLIAGTLRAPNVTRPADATFNFTGGVLIVDTFEGDLVNAGGQLSPGGASNGTLDDTTIIGGYTQQTGGNLRLQIAGDLPISQYDIVTVTDQVSLGGDLHIELLDFSPAPTDTFTVLGGDTIIGTFDNVAPGERLLTLGSLGTFVVNYGITSPFDSNEVVLSDFVAGIPGDYNGDFVVDMKDYTVWRDNLGAPEGTLPADIDGGVIGEAQYLTWRDNFGSSLNGSLQSTAIPEPAAFCLAIMGAACLRWQRRHPSRIAGALGSDC